MSALPSRSCPSPRSGLRRVAAVLIASALLVTLPIGAAHADSGNRPPNGYVAMGDSFSSGEGLFLYRSGTDTLSDQCHRSPLAYGPLLSHTLPRRQPFSFVACSGAVIADLYAPNHLYPSEPAQLSALSTRTRTVTLTLGGNDAGFRAALEACVRPRVQSVRLCADNQNLTGAVDTRLKALAGGAQVTGIKPISDVLADVAAAAPHAKIYLGGYPELFGDDDRRYAVDPTVVGQRSCTLLSTGVPAADPIIAYVDAQYLNGATRRLNGVLADAVARARLAGVDAEFVPVPVFAGHGLCDTKRSWINPVIPESPLAARSESLHPNLLGSLGYTTSFWQAFRGERPLPSSVRREAGLR